MATILIGANGQLSREILQVFCDRDLVPLAHADLELTDPGRVREWWGWGSHTLAVSAFCRSSTVKTPFSVPGVMRVEVPAGCVTLPPIDGGRTLSRHRAQR